MPSSIDPHLLNRFRCPVTESKLTNASTELLTAVNEKIHHLEISDCTGTTIDSPIELGLVNASRSLLFPILNGIVVLTADRAIPIETADETERAPLIP